MTIEKSKTSFLTSGSNGGIDDEYYINEIIGIDELTYEDYVKKPKKIQLEFDTKDVEVKF
jgi:nucleoside phosphorylase